jgi:kumamolisin
LNQGIGRNLGYLNPQLCREVGPARILREITEGNNGKAGLAGYSARSGWNAVAGWGTPDGQKLLDWLRAHPGKDSLAQ